MAKTFTSSDVAIIKKNIDDLYSKGNYLSSINQKSVIKIKNSIKNIIDNQAKKQLEDISVTELNNDKSGIRVSALKAAGYDTIGSLLGKSWYEISKIKGIGEDTAYIVEQKTNEMLHAIRKGQKIRLSLDNRSYDYTELVKGVYIYSHTDDLEKQSNYLLNKYKDDIYYSINDLSVATSSIKWLFASKKSKKYAEDAYSYLCRIIDGEYGTGIHSLYNEYKELETLSVNNVWDDFLANNIRYINTIEKIEPGVLGNDDKYYGLPEELAIQVQAQCFFPEGLLCKLRTYQEWGVKYVLRQEKVLLGDEMGLGKTIQAIATMVSLKNTGATHFMVVCPASVLSNWCREIKKMSTLGLIQIYGSGRLDKYKNWKKNGGVGVTTYETTEHFASIDSFSFDMCVVDEAHYIKNPEANRTKNVKMLCEKSKRLLFLTGTALENKVEEMISLIEVLNVEVRDKIKDIQFISGAPQFREYIAPVYYRRKREDVLSELPEKIEIEEWCQLNEYEENAYEEAILNKSFSQARRVSWNVTNLAFSSKAKRLLELVEEAESDNRKVIVFSFFLDTINAVCNILGDRCVRAIKGSVKPAERQKIIDEFDSKEPGTVLPAQIMAGGTGLNIQSASVVIICEPQFKPSIENQAISRAYRMGQSRNVQVYRLLSEGTVDERIMELLSEKQQVFDAFADVSVAAEAFADKEITKKNFGEIIDEEIERIKNKKSSI